MAITRRLKGASTGKDREHIGKYTDILRHKSSFHAHVMVYNFCYQAEREYGHTVEQWLRHCATSRKVADSRPDDVIFINLTNPSSSH
jgi:hypothetical protein